MSEAFDPEKVERFVYDGGGLEPSYPWNECDKDRTKYVLSTDYDNLLALYRSAISPDFNAANTSSASARDSHLLDPSLKQVAPLPK